MIHAEILTIGDELLIGQVVDTNAAWMGRELNKVGIEVVRMVSVRDRAEEIAEAVDAAMKRADILLLTGGLGPTKDDITKQTLCTYFQTELVFNEAVFENVKRILSGRVPMNTLNKSQAMVPKDCLVINNRVGTASVSWFEQQGKVLVSMPGVPQEMAVVMREEVIPRLCKRFQTDAIVHRTFLVKNHPESLLAEKLEEWERELPASLKLAYLPQMGVVRLRLTGRGMYGERDSLEELILRKGLQLKTLLGDDLLDDADASLEQLIGRLLRQKGLTLATAESCTGGAVAARLTSIPGSSDYFLGGVVAYANEVKRELLQVSSETLERQGAVSEQTVIEMAKGAMNRLKTDCAVAISGIAGPGGGTEEKPVGTVWIAAAYRDEIRTRKQESDRGREMNVERAGNQALLLLLDLLQ